ncbi:MAG: thiolase family protein [Actinobacteria bacterium]|nr:thiolase family protein [Actinomycetota bacterium]
MRSRHRRTRRGVAPVRGSIRQPLGSCVSQVGEQSFNVGRNAVLAAGWPESVPATTVDRQCGSSQQAVHFAAAGLVAGHYDVVIAGGVESMTRVPMGSSVGNGAGRPHGPLVARRYDRESFNQGVGAEMIAHKWGVTREEADRIGLRSHRLAAAAADSGRFDAQIVPVDTDDAGTVERDEGVRRDASLDAMATLRPAFRDDGIVTAGNASQISDGAAALLLTTSETAQAMGLRPLARVHSVALAGVDPVSMLTGPIPATQRVLERSGLSLGQIDVFEVNETFAPVIAAWRAEIGAPEERVNPNGGAIALGHPLGASGGRIMTTLVHDMVDRRLQFGLQTMCEGGGLANATILERLA